MAYRQFGEEELANLREVIAGGELWRGLKGNFVPRFEAAMAGFLGRRYVYAVNSGTSANEASVAGLGLEPGDEVICPASAPIFVSLPVFAAGCIPVFADVDPRTLIITPEGIEARAGPRTRAVVVVHLFGQPAPMDDILSVARKRGLKVIEDCAQAYKGSCKGRMTGTFGDVSCFSLQQSKHITSGEGGFIATDDPDIYKRALLYSNAGMPWFSHGLARPKPGNIGNLPTRGHFAFGHNHRMSELEAAVAFAQLGKIDTLNAARKKLVEAIVEELRGCQGLRLASPCAGTEPNYWAYAVQIDPSLASLTAQKVSGLCVEEEGVAQDYYREINYLEEVFQEAERRRRTPFGLPLPDSVRYLPGLCPKAEEAAKRTFLFPVYPSRDPQELRNQVRALRRVMERAR